MSRAKLTLDELLSDVQLHLRDGHNDHMSRTVAEARNTLRELQALVLSSSSLRTLVEQLLAEWKEEVEKYGIWTSGHWIGERMAAVLRHALLSPVEGRQRADVRGIIEALGFDPTNHHNAAKCPYCTPSAAVEGRQGGEQENTMTFKTFMETNRARCENRARALDGWLPSQWSNAMAGECGEACNLTKKMDRIWPANQFKQSWNKPEDSRMEDLNERLKRELGDVVIYADLLAQRQGLTLEDCVRTAFNEKSAEIGAPERL